MQILKHSDILSKEKLSVKFIGKNFGPELNELAMAGEVDIILTADQPAITLFAKNDSWVGVSRLMYNRTAVYVPLSSNIKSIKDLKGKTLGVPFGAAAQRVVAQEFMNLGLNPEKDMKQINLGIQEHIPLIKKNDVTAKSWDQFDALSGFDPIPAILETQKKAKVIHVGKVCSLILMNKDFIKNNKQDANKFIKAIMAAYELYRSNPVQANKWFIEESKLKDADDSSLKLAASLEPMLQDDKGSLRLTSEDYEILDKAATYMEKTLNRKVDMAAKVSEKFLD